MSERQRLRGYRNGNVQAGDGEVQASGDREREEPSHENAVVLGDIEPGERLGLGEHFGQGDCA